MKLCYVRQAYKTKIQLDMAARSKYNEALSFGVCLEMLALVQKESETGS